MPNANDRILPGFPRSNPIIFVIEVNAGNQIRMLLEYLLTHFDYIQYNYEYGRGVANDVAENDMEVVHWAVVLDEGHFHPNFGFVVLVEGLPVEI